MARSFTITFTHNKKEYIAVVAQVQNSVSVFLPDESLHDTIPNGRFSYDAGQGLNIDTAARTATEKLMLDVVRAIESNTEPPNAETAKNQTNGL